MTRHAPMRQALRALVAALATVPPPAAHLTTAPAGAPSPPARLDLAPSRLRPRASRARVASPLASSDPRSGETSVSPERVCDSHVNARGGDYASTVGNARDDLCLRPRHLDRLGPRPDGLRLRGPQAGAPPDAGSPPAARAGGAGRPGAAAASGPQPLPRGRA